MLEYTAMDNNFEWYKRLEGILAAHVPQPSHEGPHVEEAKDKLAGASFVVVNKDGKLNLGMVRGEAPGEKTTD